MRPSLRVTLVCAAMLLGGCARDYGSFYRETNRALEPRPVATEDVKVVKSARDLVTPWTGLGNYEGHAPTVKEAMDAARRECGRAGADYFILDIEPFELGELWNVHGTCAAKTPAAPRKAER